MGRIETGRRIETIHGSALRTSVCRATALRAPNLINLSNLSYNMHSLFSIKSEQNFL